MTGYSLSRACQVSSPARFARPWLQRQLPSIILDEMSTIVDGSIACIADRVRLERESRGWSLADLAARSGVSRAMLSKIERREASPTATVLVRVASAFDLTIARLIARAEGNVGRVVRAADQPVWQDP